MTLFVADEERRKRENAKIVEWNFNLQANNLYNNHLSSSNAFYYSPISTVQKKRLHECVLLFKDCKSLCFLVSTVTECWSRWIIPFIQTSAIVILKEQTYVGERNVDHFKGMMKAWYWIVLKEAPVSEWGYDRKGGKEKESIFQPQIPSLSPCRFALPINFIFPFSILCTFVVVLILASFFKVNVAKIIFGETFKKTWVLICRCCSINLTLDSIVLLRSYCTCTFSGTLVWPRGGHDTL